VLKLKDFKQIKKEIYKLEELELDKASEWRIFCVAREIFDEKGQKLERCDVKEFLLEIKEEKRKDRSIFEDIIAYFDRFYESGPDPRPKFFRPIKGYKNQEKQLQRLWKTDDLYLCECKPIAQDLYRFIGCYSEEKRFLVLVSGFKKPPRKKFRQECERAIKILKRLEDLKRLKEGH